MGGAMGRTLLLSRRREALNTPEVMAGLVVAWWLASGLPINFIGLHECLSIPCMRCTRAAAPD